MAIKGKSFRKVDEKQSPDKRGKDIDEEVGGSDAWGWG